MDNLNLHSKFLYKASNPAISQGFIVERIYNPKPVESIPMGFYCVVKNPLLYPFIGIFKFNC